MIDVNTVYTIFERYPLISLMVIGGTLVSLLGIALQQITMRSSAAQRHLILSATAIGLLALPVVRIVGPELPLHIVPVEEAGPSPRASISTPVLDEPAPDVEVSVPERTEPTEGTLAVSESSPVAGKLNLWLAAYGAGVVLVLIPLIVGTLRMRWLVSRAESLPDAASFLGDFAEAFPSDEVRILTSDSVRVPLAWGWRKAILLLPAEAVGWPREMKQDAIIHELAHLDRRDLLYQTVARIAVAVHWFNPLAWTVLRRLLLEAEQACDDRVLDAGTGTADYAERLLRISAGAHHPSLRRLSAVAMARSSQLATRIEALFEDSRPRSGRLGRARMIGTFLAVFTPVVLLGAVQLEPKQVAGEIGAESAGSSSGDVEWAGVTDGQIRVQPGDTVRVSGKGVIRFSDGRRTIRAEQGGAVLVDGRAVEAVNISEVGRKRVEIVGPGTSRWIVESWPDEKLPGSGTRISDSDPTASARVDTTLETTFYIRVDESGQAEYLEPDRERASFTVSPSSWNESRSADESPLYAAILRGSISMVEAILDAGADPNAHWDGDGNPLIIAVRQREPEIIELLLERGARPDEGVSGDGNALIVAAARGDLWSLDRFIATGADIDQGVPGDGNPLIAAAGAGQIDAMKLLVAHGADVEVVVPGDENALITAAGAGELEAVKYLVSVGANVNAAVRAKSWRTGGFEIRTPLSRARKAGHQDVVSYLKSVGARD